jgi:hypothetical protein
MFVTIITDCSDSNALGRQMTRSASLFGFSPVAMPISHQFDVPSDLEAGGHLIDVLDSCRGSSGVILLNKAPRNGPSKQWKNGTPFGYFWYHKTLVVTTVDGFALSLVKKLNLANEIQVFDIPKVMNYAAKESLIDVFDAQYTINTQFRSFEFLPRAAKWVFDGVGVPTDSLDIELILDCPRAVFFSDNFGNLKTTILPEEIGFEVGKVIDIEGFGKLKCYMRLKDLPDSETGLIIGSSGLKEKRFLEIMTQGQSTFDKFQTVIGKPIIINNQN